MRETPYNYIFNFGSLAMFGFLGNCVDQANPDSVSQAELAFKRHVVTKLVIKAGRITISNCR
jgi:hypothetical protein